VRERRSERFTRFDGNLPAGSVAVPGPDEPVSPTSMQTYAACPFRYFMEKVLGLSESERPEDVIRLSATERGTMVHRILERFVAGRIAGEDGSIDRLQAIATEEFASTEGNGITGKALLWGYDQEVIRRELHQFHARDTLTPVAVEMDFGRQGGTPVAVTLDDGRQLSFKGSADRVDRAPDGHLVVTDYKTGSTYGYGGLDTKDAVARGEKLQLPIYGLAARELYGDPDTPVEARYWFVSEKGEFAAKGYTLDDERLARFRSVLGVITEGIADGNFPARPGEENTRPGYGGFDNCGYCSFDALCARERDRHWDRKKVSVELRPYVALAEGPLVAPGEDDAAS
jgi:RecB family exonuclease